MTSFHLVTYLFHLSRSYKTLFVLKRRNRVISLVLSMLGLGIGAAATYSFTKNREPRHALITQPPFLLPSGPNS